MAANGRLDRPTPLLVVISGPSGVGKDAVMARLMERPEFVRAITMTTRRPRPDERDGVDYLFATPEEFDEAIARGELLEHAVVHGERYGTPRSSVRAGLGSGRDVLLQVDVQGASAVREAVPGAVTLFIAPENLEQIEARLRERGADEAEIGRRLDSARRELEQRGAFDHVIVNAEGEIDRTVRLVVDIVGLERGRPGREPVAV